MVFLELRDVTARRIANEPPEVVTAVIRIDQFHPKKRPGRMMGIEGVQIEKTPFSALDSDVLAVVRLELAREKLR
jgi:hypothetical protein